MARQSAPIQEVARLLDLVPFLSTHSHISLKELAREFGVTEKEMAQELTALSMCGLPGYTPYELIEIYFESGFVTINNHESLDIPRALTNLEVASLLIGLSLMKEAAVHQSVEFLARIDSLSAKLGALIGESIEVEAPKDLSYLADISKAIAERRSLKIAYLSPLRDEVEERLISPLSIYTENSSTYVNAYCHAAGALRNFRSDRIGSVSEASKIELPEVPTTESQKARFSLIVKGQRRAVSEMLSLDQMPAGGAIEVEAFSPEWMEKAVVAFSPDISLEQPAATRPIIKRKLENILALYR
jgi:proteasome accessory factor C